MTLAQAIDRSRSHTEIVAVEFAGDGRELLDALDECCDDDEIDHVEENDGTIDVWGTYEDMAHGEMDWRLRVTLTTPLALRSPEATS